MSTKILMFGWEFPPYNSGGLGPACLGITRSLAKLGVDITFVLPRKMEIESQTTSFVFAPDSVETTEQQILELKKLGLIYNITLEAVNSPLNPYLTSESYLRVLETMNETEISEFNVAHKTKQTRIYAPNLEAEVHRYGLVAAKIIEKQDFDLIHAHDWLTFPAAMRAKELSGKPLIVHIHSTEIDRSGHRGNEQIYEIEKRGMEMADKIIAVSNHTKNVIIKHYGIEPDKIVFVHNGIDLESELGASTLPLPLANLQAEKLTASLNSMKENGYSLVLFVGRLTFQKGVEYLLSAAKKVLEIQPKTLFIIAGSGDMENYLMEFTARLGISDKVIFPGFVRAEALKTLQKMADLFVMPSVSEPFGLVALESLAHRTPVIVSKTSGVSEVLQNALKVDFWDVDETASLISAVLEHDSLKYTLTHMGHHEVKQVTWDRAGVKISEVYGMVLAF